MARPSGVRQWWKTVRGAFEEIRYDLLDVRGFGDRAIAEIHIDGMLSGVELEQRMWQIIRIRDGSAVWWAFFRTEPEALEALEATRLPE